MSQRVPTALRRLVQARAHYRCEYCLIHEGQIVPLKPIGRVTEYLLQFNQPQSVQERRWLIDAGRYAGEPAGDAQSGRSADESGRLDIAGGGESVADRPAG